MTDIDTLFDRRASVRNEEPTRIPRSAPPFPLGTTAERHRELERQGYVVARGKTGPVIFRFGRFEMHKTPDK